MVEHLPLMVYYHLQISSSQCAGIGMIKNQVQAQIAVTHLHSCNAVDQNRPDTIWHGELTSFL